MATARNRHKAAIPHAKQGSVEPHAEECGAKKKRGPGLCTKPAGWRTSHPKHGRCYLHGGATPVKHGLYSKIKRASLRTELDLIEKDQGGLDLTREANLLRALIADLLARDSDPDVLAIAKLVDRLGATADRIRKHQEAKSVTLATLNRVMEQMGVEVAAAVQEVKLDPAQGTALCEIIERRWGSLRLDAYTATTASSPA